MHFESGNPSVLGIFTVVHRHYIYILLHLPFDGPPFFAKSVCVCRRKGNPSLSGGLSDNILPGGDFASFAICTLQAYPTIPDKEFLGKRDRPNGMCEERERERCQEVCCLGCLWCVC